MYDMIYDMYVSVTFWLFLKDVLVKTLSQAELILVCLVPMGFLILYDRHRILYWLCIADIAELSPGTAFSKDMHLQVHL